MSNPNYIDQITLDGVTRIIRDTTLESKQAASGGTDVSLVTTGEKYTWNTMSSGGVTGVKVNGTTHEPTAGIVDIGTVVTDVSGKIDAPSTAGTSGQVLTSDGNGGQSWQTPSGGTVTDVQIDSTSILNNGVANIPLASDTTFGVVKVGSAADLYDNGISIDSQNRICIVASNGVGVKAGVNQRNPIVPANQHKSVFYGLAKAAGDVSQASSDNAVGTYTDTAKTAIRTMIGAGTYSKPSGGIPAADLASGVIPTVPVTDVQINGSSILSDGVANIPYASTNDVGVVKVNINGTNGLAMVQAYNDQSQLYNTGEIAIAKATNGEIKASSGEKPIVASSQHRSVFYGLAKAAGDTTQASSSNAVGTYTSDAQSSIRTMIGAGTYSKPSGGIPATDIASGVIPDISGKLDSSLKGANNGLAELDSSGKVPTSQLPSYVDDVVEYASMSSFPSTGESGKIYVALDTNKTYRWSGSEYVEISPSIALGETSSTAYRGDRGKSAYDHATESGKISSAVSSGLYKFSATAQGHIASTTAVQKSDITALGIPAQDTTYQSKAAASGGTDVSLVTTGEKYTWNNKYDKPSGGIPASDLASGVIPDITGKADKTDTVLNTTLSRGRKTNTTVGEGSFAFGSVVEASGAFAHAEGAGTTASGQYAHAEGSSTTASDFSSHAEGAGTTASGSNSHAEGASTSATAYQAHAEGASTTASGANSHAEGCNTTASGDHSHAEGLGGTFTISGTSYTSQAAGMADHTEGYQCLTTSGQPGNHAEGYQTRATGGASHAEGSQTLAGGSQSHAEGYGTTTSGSQSHAEGNVTTASGNHSHAEGYSTTASGVQSHAEGNNTTASGLYAHAENIYTVASGEASHAEGVSTKATGACSHVSGAYNVEDSYASWDEWVANTRYNVGDKVKKTNGSSVIGYTCVTENTDSSFTASKWKTDNGRMNYAEIVGNGYYNSSSYETVRQNIRALDWDGNERIAGDVYVGCNTDSTGGTKLAKITDIPSVTGKADKVASATNGNFAALDSNGNLTDSGHKHSDYLASNTTYVSSVNGSSGAVTIATLPTVSSSDNDKVLKVVGGAWTASTAPSGLPAVTSADNGKVLMVVNGAWAVVSLAQANGVSF